jgi:hypothetical protein
LKWLLGCGEKQFFDANENEAKPQKNCLVIIYIHLQQPGGTLPEVRPQILIVLVSPTQNPTTQCIYQSPVLLHCNEDLKTFIFAWRLLSRTNQSFPAKKRSSPIGYKESETKVKKKPHHQAGDMQVRTCASSRRHLLSRVQSTSSG